ncbi:hypothetical protein T11_8895 [Trichinella zimbabwensis]|uniref:Uncharacterized protein n=1 Tax=Trichinella zimbabwensis TaxID=268475 RepID=A0A0V1I996_9BILA|nr:hypothetical protein T11_8895 [Trichinella zimbabwensis]KRZ19406.1 hypothetical protein T11_8895 [Trichinella zimbabwensis]
MKSLWAQRNRVTVNRRIVCRVCEIPNIGERSNFLVRQSDGRMQANSATYLPSAYPGDLERHLHLPDGRPSGPVKTLAKACQNCTQRAAPIKALRVAMQLYPVSYSLQRVCSRDVLLTVLLCCPIELGQHENAKTSSTASRIFALLRQPDVLIAMRYLALIPLLLVFQAVDTDVVLAVERTAEIIDEFTTLRSSAEDSFNSFYKKAEEMAEIAEILMEAP